MQNYPSPRTGLLGILAALAGISIPAQAQVIPIGTCDPTHSATAIVSPGSLIDKPGNYALTGNLTTAFTSTNAMDCILITASNVSLKLNGFTIKAGTGVLLDGIHVKGLDNLGMGTKVNHVAIEGPGLILGDPQGAAFQNGVSFIGAPPNFNQSGQVVDYSPQVSASQVALVTIVGAANQGIHAEGCYNLTIGSNVISQSTGGIFIAGCTSYTISGNDVSGNGGFGLLLDHFSGNVSGTVNNNVFDGNGGDGIQVQDGVQGARVYANTLDGNHNYGIEAYAPSGGNQYFSNRALGNKVLDLVDFSCASFWSGNSFLRASPCIH